MTAVALRRWALLVVAGLVVALVGLPVGGGPVRGLELPVSPVVPSAVPLPAVQIDGVAWQQLVVGDTVYVGGAFGAARPAGSDVGEDEVVRQNLLAFDIRSGELIPGFVADTNGQVLGLTMSPDGSRLYVSGEFTSVNGVARYRIAAVDPVSGAVDTSFGAWADYRVRSVVATPDVVYVGGSFGTAGGAPRSNLAAFRASDGAVLDWAPSADNGQVMAIAALPGSDRIVVGGAFDGLNGVALRGLGAVDAVSGATVPYPANEVIRNSGSSGAVYALSSDESQVYGAGYTFGSAGGNFEGNYAADADGNIVWLNDIHGDQYDVHAARGMVFTVGHLHSDFNVLGGIPQQTPSKNWYAATQVNAPGGVVQENTQNRSRYADFGGQPATEAALHWYPEFTPGTFTASNMAGWSVSGDDRYVVIAGEFTRVNNVRQQGIVRFAYRDVQSLNDPPRLGAGGFVPQVTSPAAGTAQVSWESNWDRDDHELTYWVQREGAGTIATYAGGSTFFNQPVLTHLDSGLPAGSTQRYRIVATDPHGDRAWGEYVEVTIADTGSWGAYPQAVLADRPSIYWRMSDTGTGLADSAWSHDGQLTDGVQRGIDGVLVGDADTATRFAGGTENGWVSTRINTPVTEYSTEAWVRTSTTTGGMIIGHGNRDGTLASRSSASTHRTFMGDDGRIHFGVIEGGERQMISSAQAYNDGQWHHVVATLDWTGASLYIDGALVAEDETIKHGEPRAGYWRVAWDNLQYWPQRPTSDAFEGDLDEIAVYNAALTPTTINNHYTTGTATPQPNADPVAGLSVDAAGLEVSVDGSSSSDADGSVVSYAWDFGDGASDTGVTAVHTYADAGTYTVSLTVTDDQGGTDTATQDVTVVPGNADPVAGLSVDAAGLEVSVDGSSSSDADGSVVSYAWDFGDGASDTGVTAVHTYADAGTYTVSLTVTDDQGGTDTATQDVTVVPGNADPVAGLSVDAAGLEVSVDGSSSSDADGSVVSYAWDFGDGASDTGVTAVHTYADAGTYTVSLTVTDDQGGTDTATQDVTVVPGNADPVAGLSVDAAGLEVSVDGSSSSDADGSVVSYAWDFGDGASDTGVTAVHTYADAGTYTVSLTVTDDQGGTDTATQDVTVVPGNADPVAGLSVDAAGLEVSVDGSSSSDADGSVVSYAWDFGDGASDTGVTAVHTYADAGTYTVSLTVTDDQGGTDTATQDVTVAAAGVFARDGFGRSVSSGWGAAPVGGAWLLSGGSADAFSVDGSVGAVQLDAGRQRQAELGIGQADVDMRVSVGLDRPATGGGLYLMLGARSSGDSAYVGRVRLYSDGEVGLHVQRRVDGAATTLAGGRVPGLTAVAGQLFNVRLQVSGSPDTTIRAKIWAAGDSEPGQWTVSTTDSTAALQTSGGIYIRPYLSGSTTNAPATVVVDDLEVTAPGSTPQPNADPVAGLSVDAAGLEVSVDGSSSSDADGSVVSYAWDFGDGASDTGVTAVHTYADAGTYTVSLTVTDDNGGTDTATQDVTVAAAGVFARDGFGRSVSSGWGAAPVGGAWLLSGGSADAFSVDGSVGAVQLDAGRQRQAELGIGQADVDMRVSVGLDRPATGGGLYLMLGARSSGDSAYVGRVRLYSDGEVGLHVQRRVDGAATTLAGGRVPGLTAVAGQLFNVRLQVSGSPDTTIRAKIWAAGDSEPGQWTVSTTDSTAALQTSGGIYIRPYLSGSTTNAPATVLVDDLEATSIG